MEKQQEGKLKDLIEVNFIQRNRLTYKENSLKFTMTLTKTVNGKIYFGCVHRYSATSTRSKCTATGVYNIENKTYVKKKDHLAECGIEEGSQTLFTNDSYEIQKNFLLAQLEKNQRLTTAPALELLRKENTQRAPENKLLPLTYEQIKYIIECYREENGVTSCEDLKNKIVLTKDNSIFLRYNSSYYTLHKSIYFSYISLFIR